jgi:hypothetical protein
VFSISLSSNLTHTIKFPWLMTTVAIADLLVTSTFGKMVFTDAQQIRPFLVPSASVALYLCARASLPTTPQLHVLADVFPLCKTRSRNSLTRPRGADLRILFCLPPTSSYQSDTTVPCGAQPSTRM